MKLLSKFTLIFVFLLSAVGVFAQQNNTLAEGVDLYKGGDFAGAVVKLKDTEDAAGLYYLGMSYEKLDKPNDAGKAYEKAFKASYNVLEQELEDRFEKPGKGDKEALAVFFKRLTPQIQVGAVSANNAVRLKAKMSKDYEWMNKAVTTVGLFDLLKVTEPMYAVDEVETEPVITKKSPPKYTDAARQNNITGKVKLLLVLGADGKVKNVIPIQGLPYGLTEQAVEVAKTVEFTPAMKDGKNVSTVKLLEYNFSIY